MRLGAILSRDPSDDYQEVEAFLLNRRGILGQQVKLEVGNVILSYFCSNCGDIRSFSSQGELTCIFVNKQLISVDAVLKCVGCDADVQAWFLVESANEINGSAPKVKIVKRSENLSQQVAINDNQYGDYTILLNKAEKAYREGFGAGSIVYLRKVFEKIASETARIAGIDFDAYPSGNPKNFSKLLRKVDVECSIIPEEYSKDGYRLFRELSEVVHGSYDEQIGLNKYDPLKRLIVGIIENVKNKEELNAAIDALGWDEEESAG